MSSRQVVLILFILYAVGVAGVLIPIHPDFMMLTPLNLLTSAMLEQPFCTGSFDLLCWWYGS